MSDRQSYATALGSDQSLPRMLSSGRTTAPAPASNGLAFHLRHSLKAFVAGLAITVPVAVWLSGRLDVQKAPARPPAVVIAPVSVRSVEQPRQPVAPTAAAEAKAAPGAGRLAVASAAAPAAAGVLPAAPPVVPPAIDAGKAAPGAATPRAPAPPVTPAKTTTGPEEDAETIAARLEAARALVLDGDVLAARAVLAESALRSVPEAAYVLAETYDPNVLAALGIADVRAEVELARLFYERALAGGIETARQRLEALR